MPEKEIRVLVATESVQVRRLLEQRGDVRFDIAVHTSAIRDLLPDVHLIIIDYEDLVEYELSEAEIRDEIFAARIYECSSSDFVSDPDGYLSGVAINRPGRMLNIPPRFCICFTSYSGGTGRTTLALDTAIHFAETMGKADRSKFTNGVATPGSTLLIELSFGVSALLSLTGAEMPGLSRLATDPDASLQKFRGVSLLPMDYDYARLLPSDLLQRYLTHQIAAHQLTVVDCIWPHGLADALVDEVDLWIVLASERGDAQVNARRLSDELTGMAADRHVWMLLNQADDSRNGDSQEWQIVLPRVDRSDEYAGELGQAILSRVYAPIWQDYAKPKARWFR
jgi:hypothetical protein